MANTTPMNITLYDPETNEVKSTHTRLFVPWKLLKQAVKLANGLDPENMTDADMDTLAGLVVETFGNKFSIEDLNNGADVGEMVTVLNTIIAKASGGIANPTPPGK
jgi:hypothetical protein